MRLIIRYTGIIFILYLLGGCATPPDYIPEKLEVNRIDFTAFSEKGFLITPEKYNGDYESMGLITLTFRPFTKRNKILTSGGTEVSNLSHWEMEKIEHDSLLNSIYEICTEMGADAFTQLEMHVESVIFAQNTTQPVEIPEITISGFAIKRRGAFQAVRGE